MAWRGGAEAQGYRQEQIQSVMSNQLHETTTILMVLCVAGLCWQQQELLVSTAVGVLATHITMQHSNNAPVANRYSTAVITAACVLGC